VTESQTLGAYVVELVDAAALRDEVRSKYRAVADKPSDDFHFHTGREHAVRLGYPEQPLMRLPEEATEAFAGVANPFLWGLPEPGERVVDLGCGAGMDSFIAAMSVGREGHVVGIDMTPQMVERATRLAEELRLENVEFREGLIEDLPVASGSADRVISNGVINLCPDKLRVYEEVHRVLRPGGRMTIADICVEKPVPAAALKDIDLWTG